MYGVYGVLVEYLEYRLQSEWMKYFHVKCKLCWTDNVTAGLHLETRDYNYREERIARIHTPAVTTTNTAAS